MMNDVRHSNHDAMLHQMSGYIHFDLLMNIFSLHLSGNDIDTNIAFLS